jgi:hypothetical protein
MKLLTALLFVAFAFSLNAQKLPQLKYTSSLFSNHYMLGDKEVKFNDVIEASKQVKGESYHLFKDASRASTNGLLWSVLALGGTLVGVFTTGNTSTTAYGVSVAGSIGTIVCVINANSREKKAINEYNKQAGY